MIKDIMNEFKKFVMRGSVIDMAVGIIIGGAFTKIVNSMVADVMMPPLGLLIGKVDFSNWFVVIKQGTTAGPYATIAEAQSAGATTMNLGLFLNAIISFVIVAFCIFLLIKAINKLNAPKGEAAPIPVTTKKCPYCCSEIPLEATRCPHCTSEIK